MDIENIRSEINKTIRNGTLTKEEWYDSGVALDFDMPDGTKKHISLYAAGDEPYEHHSLYLETMVGDDDITTREIRIDTNEDFGDISNFIGDALMGEETEAEPTMEMTVRFVWKGTQTHVYSVHNGKETEVGMDYVRDVINMKAATVEFIEAFLSEAFDGRVMG